MGKRLIFLLGGARSGKSVYAENWAREHGDRVLFVATAQAFDDEMRERIAAHRASRPAGWRTLEAPLNVGQAIQAQGGGYDTVLVDCLTLLASNALLQLPEGCAQGQAEAAILSEVDALLSAYRASSAAWLVVSNEVGMGIVPPYRLGRLYRDALGRANQRVAQHADEVLLLVAGLPWRLKQG
ncbi:MAG: bifunctional adenosylcobinamide kinase/adenosylcobinamide-phosphate guanylyltransferase [Aggregatilineales bacterium]